MKLEEGFSEWFKEAEDVEWLQKDSDLWQDTETYIIREINKISEPELQEFVRSGIRFNQRHLQSVRDAIKTNSYLNITTKSNIRNLQKLETYQALNTLEYTNYLFIGLKSLKIRRKEISNLWPCKWSDVMVIDCDCNGNVADILLDILRETADSAQSSDSCNGNEVGTLVGILEKYQQNVIIISTGQHREFAASFEGNCDMLNLDEESQSKILERTVNFQGTGVALQTLVGTDPPEWVKHLVDCDVMSILLNNEDKLRVGRELSDLCQHYVPRVLQHHVYLKEDILKLPDNTTTFAVSGLQVGELQKYLPDGEKICELQYDESGGNQYFEIVSDFFKIDLSAEMKAHQSVGQKLKSDYVKSIAVGKKNTKRDFSESIEINTIRTADNLFKSVLSAELENMNGDNTGKKIKPEEVRYISLGYKNTESKFRDLRKLCKNVHWVHVEEGSLLWRESSCNIDIIRRYINQVKCKKNNIERVMEQSDRTVFLVAEPGMGKSTFLSHMEHEIKKRNTAVWVLRINLNKYTSYLDATEFKNGDIDKCKMFLWNAANLNEQGTLEMTKEIFLQALDKAGRMVIILDGFDEISTDYIPKVSILIRTITDKTASQIFVSSRFSYRQNLEDIGKKLAFTLQPFTPENQIEFLEEYWNRYIERQKEGILRIFAEKLLILCSQNFSDKDGEFTGIPLQTMMLGEAFVTEAVEYCSTGEINLPEKFNLLYLFNKFWEKKCDIYFNEKNVMDSSKPEVKWKKKSYLGKHMIASLISLFSLSEENGLVGAINVSQLEQANRFMESGRAEQFGIIREVIDRKPQFIHRCFAEYFAAKWFTGNFSKCENFISKNLFKSMYEVTRNIFDRMLAEDFKMHCAVLNNDIEVLAESLKIGTNINLPDKGGRTALHLAASYNKPFTKTLLSNPVVDANIPDAVLKWTPLRYADRTKSWMAMDILLRNGANPDDIVLTRHKREAQEWGQRALWECASQGYTALLDFMLNCGIDVNAVVAVPENILQDNTLLHIASIYGQLGVIQHLVERGADINIFNAKYATAHEIINSVPDKELSADLTNAKYDTQRHVSALIGNLEATKPLVETVAPLKNEKKIGETPLLLAAKHGKLEAFRYFTEIGADINIPNAKGNTALHHAAITGSVEIINILINKGMSADLTTANGFTPLHLSAQKGYLEATKALDEGGAPLNDRDEDGDTPVILAANLDNLKIFRYLTEMGADINITNAKGETAIHHAALSGSVEIINILLDKGMST
jgi:ankyrin repeat protein